MRLSGSTSPCDSLRRLRSSPWGRLREGSRSRSLIGGELLAASSSCGLGMRKRGVGSWGLQSTSYKLEHDKKRNTPRRGNHDTSEGLELVLKLSGACAMVANMYNGGWPHAGIQACWDVKVVAGVIGVDGLPDVAEPLGRGNCLECHLGSAANFDSDQVYDVICCAASTKQTCCGCTFVSSYSVSPASTHLIVPPCP